MSINMHNTPYTHFIEELAEASGSIIRRYFRNAVAVDTKSDQSPVTIADREAEEVIRCMIENTFPDHGIIGEEYGKVRENSDYVWIVDPIDGTKSFMIGRPIFGTLISLTYKGHPVLGCIDQPISGERWIGAEQQGATLNGRRIHTRQGVKLADSALATTARELFSPQEGCAYDALAAKVKFANYGGDCYNYALLASGWVDIVLESGLKPHDFCALAPVIIEAGGVCTDWQGNPLTVKSSGQVLACGSKELHQEVLELLNI